MYKEIETYNYKMHYFSGIKSFWIVQNNQSVTDAIKKINDGDDEGAGQFLFEKWEIQFISVENLVQRGLIIKINLR